MSPGRNRKSAESAEPASAEETPEKRRRSPRTLYLDDEMVNRARAAVHHVQGYVPEAKVRSLSDLFEPACWEAVKNLERLYNEGKPFPPVQQLGTGRPKQS